MGGIDETRVGPWMCWNVRCGGRMRILAAIEDPSVARKTLDCLGLPSRPPGRSRSPEPTPRNRRIVTAKRDAFAEVCL